jgi:hypothetical protein
MAGILALGRQAPERQGFHARPRSLGVDATAVADFYRRKGYTVRDGVKATGASGNEHKVPLLAEGPLGSLAVFFGDFGGVDGPEMGGARKVARDLGATPVLAADTFSNEDRQVAARLGVVLVDADALADEGPASIPSADPARAWPGLTPRRKADEPEPHPWPASGRVGGRDGPATRAVDIDDLLAARPAAPDAVPAEEQEPATPMAEVAPTPAAAEPEGAGLWKRPRAREAAAARPPRAGTTKFAWLGTEAGGEAGPAEHDSVVAAKTGKAMIGEPEQIPLEEPAVLQPPSHLADRMARRAVLQRRLYWLLFGFVLFMLLYLFWTGRL